MTNHLLTSKTNRSIREFPYESNILPYVGTQDLKTQDLVILGLLLILDGGFYVHNYTSEHFSKSHQHLEFLSRYFTYTKIFLNMRGEK